MRGLFLLAPMAVFVTANPTDLLAQKRDSTRALQVAQAIRGREVIRVKTVQMLKGHTAVRSPSVHGDQLMGVVSTEEGDGEVTIPIADISEIKVRSGTKVLEGLGIGALVGGSIIAGVEAECYKEPGCDPDRKPTVYGAALGASLVAGTLIGLAIPRWKTLYEWRVQPNVATQ